MPKEPPYANQTALIGILAMLLAAVLYVALGFAPDLPRNE